MATEPNDAELETLRTRVAELEALVVGLNRDIDRERSGKEAALQTVSEQERELTRRAELVTALEATRDTLSAELTTKNERVGTLEQLCTDVRTILDRHAPAPQTDLEALVAEFVGKLPKG